MTTFPINEEKHPRWFRKTDWDAKFVDVNELPAKMYFVLDGKLKAIKKIATAYAFYDDGKPRYSASPNLYLVADVAGEGRKNIRLTCGWTKFYHSVEDFKADRAFTLRGKALDKVLNDAGVQTHDWSGTMYPVYYSWDSHACKVCCSKGSSIGLPVSVWSDSYGVHVEWSSSEDVCIATFRYNLKGKMYRTAEDCKKDNAVQVVEFEDEQKPTGIMNTTNGHDPALVEKINEAWDAHQIWWEFTLIVGALMHRDGSQILDFLGKEIAEYTDDEKMVAELGPEYLQHVADDMDLKQIIDFIGI